MVIKLMHRINTTFSGAQEISKMTFGTGCLSQFLRNQFNHRKDVYETCNVCACFTGCFLGVALKT